MIKHRLQIVLYTLFIMAYLGFILYFLTIRPGGRDGNIVIIWTITAFASGGMMMMAVYAITLYMFRHMEKAALFFALICISAGIRFLVMEGSETIKGLIPAFPSSVTHLLRYLCIGACLIGINRFIYEIFFKPRYKKLTFFLDMLVFIFFSISGIISAQQGYDKPIARLSLFLLTFFLLLYFIVQVIRSQDFKNYRLNLLYLMALFIYIGMSVFAAFLTDRMPHTAVISNTFLVIVHVIMLSNRYVRAINDNEYLDMINRTKSELFTTMSHEMRTPLTVMSAYAQFAVEEIREHGANEQTLADLSTISSEANRLAQMADGTLRMLLDETKTVPGEQKKTPVDICDLSKRIMKLLEPIAAGNRQKMSLQTDDKAPPVSGDISTLTQALWNILHNAITHSGCKNIVVTVGVCGSDVEITVNDDGCGIEDDILPHIFERGIAGKKSGGIGLSICREIVVLHNGYISVKSEAGKGTTVTVRLPGINVQQERGV